MTITIATVITTMYSGTVTGNISANVKAATILLLSRVSRGIFLKDITRTSQARAVTAATVQINQTLEEYKMLAYRAIGKSAATMEL